MTQRTVGPVTAASSLGAAMSIILLGIFGRLGLELTELEAGAIVVAATTLGGYLVKPRGQHAGQ